MEDAKMGQQSEAAARRIAELEKQANKQRTSHKARLEELQRYYDKELAKVRGEGEVAGRTAAEAGAREKMVAREREIKDAAAAEVAQSAKQLKEELKRMRAQLTQAEAKVDDALQGLVHVFSASVSDICAPDLRL